MTPDPLPMRDAVRARLKPAVSYRFLWGGHFPMSFVPRSTPRFSNSSSASTRQAIRGQPVRCARHDRLSERDVAALLPMDVAVDVVERAMIAVSRGKAVLPLRTIMGVGGSNMMGMMPGSMSEPPCYGIKLVSLFPAIEAGYSSHQGAVVLFEAAHGSAIAMMNAGLLTAVRTAAASASPRGISRVRARRS